MSVAVVLLSMLHGQVADQPVPRQTPRPATAPYTDLSPRPTRASGLKPMVLQPIGSERVIDDADRGERLAIEKARLGPDGEHRRILGLPKFLRPVEALSEDVTALGTSLRVGESQGTPFPVGFKHVYEAPDNTGQLVRGNGAVYLVYPYGAYARIEIKRGGMKQYVMVPVVPAGSTFHIGMPKQWRAQPPQRTEAPFAAPSQLRARISTAIDLRVDGRADLRLGQAPEPLPGGAPPVSALSFTHHRQSPVGQADGAAVTLPRITSDERYRRERLEALRSSRSQHPSHDRSPADVSAPASPGDSRVSASR